MTRLDDLLAAIPSDRDREEVRELARAAGPDARGPELDHLRERIAFALRAARFPLPTRPELERMLREQGESDEEE